MSNPLTTFIFEGASIRVFGDSVSPLFVAADICNALNLTNPSMAIASLAPFERAKLNLGAGKPDVNVVNESGLYTLILRSRDAVKEGTPAYRFRVKVTNEILPAIRKTGSYSAATLTPAEQLQIRKAISARAKKSAVAYQTIYHALYAHFQVAKYDQIRSEDLQTALDFIATCEVKLPALEDKNSITLSRDEMERIRTLVYYKKYLFRRELDLVYQLLVAVQSPEAPRFYEMMNEANMNEVEKILAHHDMAVKDLPCYRYLMSH
jgi:prophage antirepressor-like protein